MEIGVLVEREDARTGERTLCANARATFVNIGEDGRPCPVPPLLAETEEDQRLAAEATERRSERRSA
jgi:acyl-CoA hydrolase